MIYIDSLTLAGAEDEATFFFGQRRKCFDTYYPFQIFPRKELERVDFSDITILYGGNGSGKSTFLNVLAGKLDADRDTVYNRSNFFEDYLELCELRFEDKSFTDKKMLTSDAVFDNMLDIRNLNQGIDIKREEKFEDYFRLKEMNDYNAGSNSRLKKEIDEIRRDPLGNIDKIRLRNLANSKTQSQFVRRTLPDNVREQSNGESAFDYFVNKINRDGIYILDEPENSLSPQRQLELVKFLEDSVRFFNCQFVIATHSPFVLSIKGAKIYDLDAVPVDLKHWTELKNVRAYYEFFKAHENEF